MWPLEMLTVATFAEQNGKTLLTLYQATFPKAEERTDHQGGWTQCFDRLVEYVARSA